VKARSNVLPQAYLVPGLEADAFPSALQDAVPILAASADASADEDLQAHSKMAVARQASSADRERQVRRRGVTPLAALRQAAHWVALRTVRQAPPLLRALAAHYSAPRQEALRQLQVRVL
jgi:hypothetical protein